MSEGGDHARLPQLQYSVIDIRYSIFPSHYSPHIFDLLLPMFDLDCAFQFDNRRATKDTAAQLVSWQQKNQPERMFPFRSSLSLFQSAPPNNRIERQSQDYRNFPRLNSTR